MEQDPSANVLLLVGNAKEYLEEMQKQTREFLEAKLQLAIETSQRERAVESRRVDANRENDNEAVKVANERADKKAELLATQLIENAENLRASMSKSAETLATQLQQVTNSLAERLKIVEEKQYSLAGASKGSRDMWGWISAGIILLIAIAGFLSGWK